MASPMHNDRFDDITYDNGWQSSSVPETYVPPDETEASPRKSEKNKKKDKASRPKKPFRSLLLAVQLVLCMLILAAAMVFKQFGGDKYTELKALYFEYLNNSLFQTPPGNLLDLSEIFGKDAETEGSTENTENNSQTEPSSTEATTESDPQTASSSTEASTESDPQTAPSSTEASTESDAL